MGGTGTAVMVTDDGDELGSLGWHWRRQCICTWEGVVACWLALLLACLVASSWFWNNLHGRSRLLGSIDSGCPVPAHQSHLVAWLPMAGWLAGYAILTSLKLCHAAASRLITHRQVAQFIWDATTTLLLAGGGGGDTACRDRRLGSAERHTDNQTGRNRPT